MSALWLVVVVVIGYGLIRIIQRTLTFVKYARDLNQFPQLPKHQIWGHLYEFPGPNEAGLQYQRDIVSRFHTSSVVWIGPFLPLLFVFHPETMKPLLKASGTIHILVEFLKLASTRPKYKLEQNIFLGLGESLTSLSPQNMAFLFPVPKAATMYDLVRPWIGDGLILTKGRKWSRNRRLLTPAFHFDILKPYITVKNRAADVLLNKIQKFSESGESFEVFNEISLYTLDVISRCAFSYHTDCQNIGSKHPYVNAVSTMSKLAVQRFLKPWLHNEWLYFLTPDGREFKRSCDFVHMVAEMIIENRRKALATRSAEAEAERSKRCKDFLDILLTARDETGEGLSPQEIRDEVDTFLFAGHDTTASALSWTLYSLAKHPEHQEAVYREIEEVMAAKKDTDIEMDDMSKMPYLTMCLKESIRLHTPVPVITRCTTEDIIVDGRKVPKDTIVVILLYNIHHNELLWPDPLEFQPDRFAPEYAERRDPYTFVPFSAGPRNCIGQNFAMHEMKVVLARLLYRFKLELDKNHVVKKEESIVMKAENGILMKARPRNSVL